MSETPPREIIEKIDALYSAFKDSPPLKVCPPIHNPPGLPDVPSTIVRQWTDERGSRHTAYVAVLNSATEPNEANAELIVALVNAWPSVRSLIASESNVEVLEQRIDIEVERRQQLKAAADRERDQLQAEVAALHDQLAHLAGMEETALNARVLQKQAEADLAALRTAAREMNEQNEMLIDNITARTPWTVTPIPGHSVAGGDNACCFWCGYNGHDGHGSDCLFVAMKAAPASKVRALLPVTEI